MSIRLRLLLLLGGATVVVLAGLAVLYLVQQRQLQQSSANVVHMYRTMTEGIVALKGQPLVGMANDYTFWDDMVAFVKSQDTVWASQNINTSLVTFGIDRVWVLSPDGKVVYATASDGSSPVPPLPSERLIPRIGKDKLPHFFVATADGLLEMVGASIHPTWDTTRVSPPAGYLLIGRIWNTEHLQSLASILDAKLRIAIGSTQPVDDTSAAEGRVVVTLPLGGIGTTPAAWLTLNTRSDHLATLQASYRATFICAVAIGVLLILVTATVLRLYVGRPLQQLTWALENESVARLDNLQDASDEFGKLARLIAHFFIQKHRLEEEVAAHVQTHEALRASELKFTQIFDNVPVGLLALDDQLNITHLNFSILTKTGYLRPELQGEHLSMIVHPEDWSVCQQTLREIRSQERIFHRSQIRYLDRGGRVLHMRQTDIGIFSLQNQFLFIVSMLEALDGQDVPTGTSSAASRDQSPPGSSQRRS